MIVVVKEDTKGTPPSCLCYYMSGNKNSPSGNSGSGWKCKGIFANKFGYNISVEYKKVSRM